MRTTIQIIIALKENESVEPEEMKLALLALNSIDHFIGNALNDLIEAVDKIDVTPKSQGLARLKAEFAKGTRERMFQAIKTDPAKWLGPSGIPGTPEHDAGYRTAKAIGKAAGVL